MRTHSRGPAENRRPGGWVASIGSEVTRHLLIDRACISEFRVT